MNKNSTKNTLPTSFNHSALAFEFEEFFDSKITNIRTKINDMSNTSTNLGFKSTNSSSHNYACHSDGSCCLKSFSSLSDEEIHLLIKELNNKYCDLDPTDYGFLNTVLMYYSPIYAFLSTFH